MDTPSLTCRLRTEQFYIARKRIKPDATVSCLRYLIYDIHRYRGQCQIQFLSNILATSHLEHVESDHQFSTGFPCICMREEKIHNSLVLDYNPKRYDSCRLRLLSEENEPTCARFEDF